MHTDLYRGALWLVCMAALGTGCTTTDPLTDWDDQELAARVRAYEQSGELERAADKIATPSTPDASMPETADVDWFIAHAMARNPSILAAHQRMSRVQQRIAQVKALPDPMATVSFGQMAETAAGRLDLTVGVQQSLPFPGTLDARARVARKEVEQAQRDLQSTIEQVRGEVRRIYASYFAVTREGEVLEQNLQLLKQIETTVNARARVGQAGQDEQLRVSRQLAAMENHLSTAKQRQYTARAMLGQLISMRSSGSLPKPNDHDAPKVDLDREQLNRLAMQNNPQVRVFQAKAGSFRSRLGLARRERLPDFMVGLQYGVVAGSGLSPAANGRDQVVGTIGVSIPLSQDRYDAAEQEALYGVGEAIAEVRAAQDRAAYAIDDAIARFEAGAKVLGRLRERMMPDARQTIKVGLRAYQTGKLDLPRLLEDWEALLDDQLQEARAISDMNRALADIEQAIGQPIPHVEPKP